MDTKIVIKNTVLEAHVLLYGATLQKLIYKDTNVVLGYETEAKYRKNGGYLGATVGRYANRIACGRFEIDGREYNVGCNEEDIFTAVLSEWTSVSSHLSRSDTTA